MARASKWLKALIKPILKTDVGLTIELTNGHTANAVEVKSSAGATLFSVSAAGAMTPAVNSYVDNVFELKDNGDATKKATFQCSGITAGQTRVFAFPNFDGTLATLAGTEALTNKTLGNTNDIELKDTKFVLQDDGDATKKAAFQCSGVTAGQKRTLTIPDYDGTIATLAGAESFTNKSLTSPKVVTGINDTNGAELVKVTATADAINELTIANAAAGTSPAISGTGDDANVSVVIVGKGTGKVVCGSRAIDYIEALVTDNAGVNNYTAAQILGGFILRDCNGAPRTDVMPAAADLVAAIPGAVANKTAFRFTARNTSGAANTLTIDTPGAAVTLSGTMTIAQNNTREFLVLITNVGAGTEAYTVYSLPTGTH